MILSTSLPPLRGKISLIYIDPPFASRSNYRTCCTLKGRDGSFTFEQQTYSDTWQGGMAGYLQMLYPRLYLMRELLSEQGSLIVHLDWHAVHYVKVLLDDIFGSENFRNEIAWCYGGGGAAKGPIPKSMICCYGIPKAIIGPLTGSSVPIPRGHWREDSLP